MVMKNLAFWQWHYHSLFSKTIKGFFLCMERGILQTRHQLCSKARKIYRKEKNQLLDVQTIHISNQASNRTLPKAMSIGTIPQHYTAGGFPSRYEDCYYLTGIPGNVPDLRVLRRPYLWDEENIDKTTFQEMGHTLQADDTIQEHSLFNKICQNGESCHIFIYIVLL